MTNPERPPESGAPVPAAPAAAFGQQPPARPRNRADLVLAVLLAVGLLAVAGYSAVGLSLAIAMSADGCGAGSGSRSDCVSSDAVFSAWLISMALLVIAVAVGLGGLVLAAVRRRVLSWWPLAGYGICVLAWIIAIAIID